MKLGQTQTRPGRKLPPPRVTQTTKTETNDMSTEDTTTAAEKAPKLPIHLKYADQVQRAADRLAQRKTGHVPKLRQRLDDWRDAETDDAVRAQLVEMAAAIDDAVENLAKVAKGLLALPEDFSKRPTKSKKPKIETGTICRIKEKHEEKYKGILPAMTGLKVMSLRKTHVAIAIGEENYVVQKSHLTAEAGEDADDAAAE